MLDFFQPASVAGKDDFGNRKQAKNHRFEHEKTSCGPAGMPEC